MEYKKEQIEEIKAGVEAGIDVSSYSNPKLQVSKMKIIKGRLIHIKKIIEKYKGLKDNYEEKQEEQIQLGIEAGIEVEIYAHPGNDWITMESIRKGLEEIKKCEIAKNRLYNYPNSQKPFFALTICKKWYNMDFLESAKEYNYMPYSNKQARQIHMGVTSNIDVSIYARPYYSWKEMREIRCNLERIKNILINEKIKECYNIEQKKEILAGVESEVDVSIYINPKNTWKKMKEIRKLLEQIHDGEKAGIIIKDPEFGHPRYIPIAIKQNIPLTKDNIMWILRGGEVSINLFYTFLHDYLNLKYFAYEEREEGLIKIEQLKKVGDILNRANYNQKRYILEAFAMNIEITDEILNMSNLEIASKIYKKQGYFNLI